MKKTILKRILFSAFLGLLIATLINEVSYRILKTSQDRPPKTVTIEIPAGTAERVALGEADDPNFPSDLEFVIGDRLVIQNNDIEAHQLGPFFVPAGASATLVLDKVQNFSYACSFRTDKSLNLNVGPAVTVLTRFQGVIFSALPMMLLFSLYGLIALPLKPEEKAV